MDKKLKDMRYRLFFLLLSLLCVGQAVCQDMIPIPYSFGFEDGSEINNWVLNSTKQGNDTTFDRWMTGNLESYEGHKSLYISCDTGKTVKYGTRPNIAVTYRRLEFPIPAGQTGHYDVSFNWKGMGVEGQTGLWVCVLGGRDSVSIPDKGVLPAWVKASARLPMLVGQTKWNQASFNLDIISGREVKIAFIWQNMNTDPDAFQPWGGCVDNIQITSRNCFKPYELGVDAVCDTIHVSWKGTSENYELEWRQRGGKMWRKMKVKSSSVSQTTVADIVGVEEGAYDVRVRGICATDTSAYVYDNTAVVFCPEKHCINYVDLSSPQTRCEVGQAGSANFTVSGAVDYGPDDKYSRHTVCWTQDQYDPRTKNQLRTIPEGEFASVRLGNWNNGGEAEAISYEYTVDSAAASILLLKYAVVLEDPGHEKEQQPAFKLEILAPDGSLVDNDCGEVHFEADINRPGWHPVGDELVWKDWTTVGYNLGKYDGQTLTIRLTTQDCTMTAHYGYAYFTLGCTKGQITGNSCGDEPFISLSAPEGFRYSWYNMDKPEFSSEERTIEVPSNDITTYYCDCTFDEPGMEMCVFTLNTLLFPRFPKADFDVEFEYSDCQGRVKLNNRSAVVTRIDGVETVLEDEACQTFYWDIDNSAWNEDEPHIVTSEVSPSFAIPDFATRIPVSLIAGIAGDKCQDDTLYYIDVPQIGVNRDTVRMDTCPGNPVLWGSDKNSQLLMKSGTYYDSLKNRYGCDSIMVLELNVWPQPEDSLVYDTICFGDVYEWDGVRYTEANYPTKGHELWTENGHGCDSVVKLFLHVHPEVRFEVRKKDPGNVPGSGVIEIVPDETLTGWSYAVNGVPGGELTGLDGGEYLIEVYNEYGCKGDTVVQLYAEPLDVVVGAVEDVCFGDREVTVPYVVNSGAAERYSVDYNQAAHKAMFVDVDSAELEADRVLLTVPDGCAPGVYAATVAFYDVMGGERVFPIDFAVRYDSAIVVQKWNDVLALLDSAGNGGYSFSQYQWYRNDVPIGGATSSYYYVEGEDLSADDSYYVVVRRRSDGVELSTCPIVPEVRSGFAPTISVSRQQGASRCVVVADGGEEFVVDVYTSVGQWVSRWVSTGGRAEVELLRQGGVYVLRVYSEGFEVVRKVVI